ncbi:MAG: carbohydrate kinase family protein [Zoogloeaceae bacterium]|nr:carbohydrate kinase family protein [Zoogloeaceae bacterium]
MTILVCGSVAYDTIMVFHDRFRNHILPDRIHVLNVAFLVPDMRREFGGCAGNIAYNLKLLGADARIMATVGDDAGPYLARLDALGLSRANLRQVSGTFTAQAFITTDLDDNQITAFHPGAMSFAHENRVADAPGVKLGIVAPDGRDGMVQHAEQFAAAGVPFIFDPGQGLPMFNGEDLLHFLNLATWCAVNDYEAQMLCERTGLSLEAIAERIEALVVTRGAEGSQIYTGGGRIDIPGVAAERIEDPTGCGDAYRSGLLYGIANEFGWERTGRLASVMGAIKIAQRGGQNHSPSRDDIARIYREAFGEELWS